MILREVDKTEYAGLASKFESENFLASVEMSQRYLDRGNEAYLLGLFDDKECAAVMLAVSKRKVLGQKIFNLPRGPVMNFENEKVLAELTEKLGDFLKAKGAMAMVMAPNLRRARQVDDNGKLIPEAWPEGEAFTKDAEKLGWKALGEYEFAKWIYTLPTEELDADNIRMRTDHRRTTRLATERYGLKLRQLGYDELNILDEIVHEAGERHGFPDPGLKYYQEMARAFGDKVEFWVAETPEQVPIAAAMFVFWDNEVVYLYSGSKSEYKKLGGPHLMQKMMIERAIKLDTLYNFYGVMPEPGNGVYEFKRGYKGRVEEYVGTFLKPLNWLGKIWAIKQRYAEMKDVH